MSVYSRANSERQTTARPHTCILPGKNPTQSKRELHTQSPSRGQPSCCRAPVVTTAQCQPRTHLSPKIIYSCERKSYEKHHAVESQALIRPRHCELNPSGFDTPVGFDLSVPVQLKQRHLPKFKLNLPACSSCLPPFFPVKWTPSCTNSDLSHRDADTITNTRVAVWNPTARSLPRHALMQFIFIQNIDILRGFFPPCFHFTIKSQTTDSWDTLSCRQRDKMAVRKTMRRSLTGRAMRWRGVCGRHGGSWPLWQLQAEVCVCGCVLETQSLRWRGSKGDGVTVTGSHISTAGRDEQEGRKVDIRDMRREKKRRKRRRTTTPFG